MLLVSWWELKRRLVLLKKSDQGRRVKSKSYQGHSIYLFIFPPTKVVALLVKLCRLTELVVPFGN